MRSNIPFAFNQKNQYSDEGGSVLSNVVSRTSLFPVSNIVFLHRADHPYLPSIIQPLLRPLTEDQREKLFSNMKLVRFYQTVNTVETCLLVHVILEVEYDYF